MLGDFAYWWRAGWRSRAALLAGAAVFLLILPWFAYDAITEPARWAAYKAAHHCVVTLKPGEGGPEADGGRNGYWLYECDAGVVVHRLPRHP